MEEARRRVRDALGPDAVIVAAGDSDDGRDSYITAAVANDEADFDGAGFEDIEAAARREIDDAGDPTAAIAAALETHGVPKSLADQLILALRPLGMDGVDPLIALSAAFDDRYRFAPLSERLGPRPLMLVGPAGGGKTLTLAKLAAQATLRGSKPRLATLDGGRAGGIEQLAGLVRLLDVTPQVAATEEQLALFAKEAAGGAVLIDSAAVNPFDRAAMECLASFAEAAGAEPVLVVAGGGDREEMADIGALFADIGVSRVIASRLDATRRFGGVLAAADAGALRFADAGIAPHVGDGLIPLNPVALARILLGGGRSNQHQSSTEAAE